MLIRDRHSPPRALAFDVPDSVLDFDDEACNVVSPSTNSVEENQDLWETENGRDYPKLCRHPYGLPRDKDEDKRELIKDKVYSLALNDRHILAPIKPEPQRILDLGCGGGYLLNAIADKYPSATVVGFDLVGGWVDVATNAEIQICDVELGLPGIADNSVDLIVLRDPFLWLRDADSLFTTCWRVLKPDGHLETQGSVMLPKCEDGTAPHESNFADICQRLLDASVDFGTPGDLPAKFKDKLTAAGFINVQELKIPVPCSPWSTDAHQKALGRCQRINLLHGSHYSGLRISDRQQLEVDMFFFRKELRDTNSHWYFDQ